MLADRARELLAMAAAGGASQDTMRRAGQDLIEAARGADPVDVGAALEMLGGAYALPHLDRTMLPLMVAGALVERGADATPLVAPVIAFLRRTVPLATEFHAACAARIPADADNAHAAFGQAADQLRQDMPNAAEAWGALEALYFPAIAVLSVSPAARAQGRAMLPGLNELRAYNAGASWLSPMLMVLDREPILVIEPDTGLGLVGRMSGISSNFQLHVLLMDVFPHSDPHGARVSRKAADVVRGNVPEQQDDAAMTGRWNLYAWTALRGSAGLPNDTGRWSNSTWIWNEGVPADIPVFDGHRVVLLGPPSYPRSFRAQRDFLALRADVEIESLLSSADVNAWARRFAQASPDDGRR